jgi:hypothetical protein
MALTGTSRLRRSVPPVTRLVPFTFVIALAVSGAALAGATYDVTVVGTEVPPISSTLGTFVGAAHGDLVGAWRIQIAHEPLRTGPTVAITGGTFSMRLDNGGRLSSAVVGGSVTVSNAGAHCRNQLYAVSVELRSGSFAGTLTHRRRSVLGRCLIYAATITGRASLAAA